jgi:hypothetical protein
MAGCHYPSATLAIAALSPNLFNGEKYGSNDYRYGKMVTK